MSNNDIPPGWSMHDDQSNKVREALRRKSIKPEDRVQEAVEEIARDIASIEPDPHDWGWWVTHLLEQLEEEANKGRNHASYEAMLLNLRDALDKRIKGGKW